MQFVSWVNPYNTTAGQLATGQLLSAISPKRSLTSLIRLDLLVTITTAARLAAAANAALHPT